MTYRYTEPDNPKLFEYMGRPRWAIMKATLLGTAISGIATGAGVFILTADYHMAVRLLLAIISPFFLEGLTHAFSQLFAEGVGNAAREKEKRTAYVILSFVFLILLLVVGGTNMHVSVLAGRHTVDYAFGSPETFAADSSEYRSLSNNAIRVFEADSMAAGIHANGLEEKMRDSLGKVIARADTKLYQLRLSYQNTNWYNLEIRKYETAGKRAKREMKTLPSLISRTLSDSLAAARAKMLLSEKEAENAMLAEEETAEIKTLKAKEAHETEKGQWKGIMVFLISIGVLSALIRYLYIEVRDLVGGRQRLPKPNEYERKESLLIRAYDAVYLFFYSWAEHGIEKLERASRKKLPKKQASEDTKQAEAERKQLEAMLRERQRMEEENRRLEHEAKRRGEEARLQAEEARRRESKRKEEGEKQQTERGNVRDINTNANKQPPSAYPTKHTKQADYERLFELARSKYPMFGKQEIGEVMESLKKANNLPQLVRTNFNNRKRGKQPKNEKERETFYRRSLKIDMGSFILSARGYNVFVKDGNCKVNRRAEEETVVNEFDMAKAKA